MDLRPDSNGHPGLPSALAGRMDQKAQSCALFSVNGSGTAGEAMRLSGLAGKASVYAFDPRDAEGGRGIGFDFAQHDQDGLEKADTSLLCDCLEYVADPAVFVAGLAKKTDKSLVLSYPGREFYPDRPERERLGWKNHFIKDDIIGLFTARDFMVSGFEINHTLKRLIFEFKTGRQNTVQDNFLCCGCSACVYRCPTDAIYEKQDVHGIYRAFVDYDKCTTCGKCSRACPVITFRPSKKNTATPKCYAFECDESISMKSATTGGFQIMARNFIKEGGKVAGAAWVQDERGNYTRVRHVLASSEAELEKIYKSKYVQSDIGDIFLRIKEELGRGTRVLFSGLPCQVAGLYNAIGRGHENLYTVDLLCGSTPSQEYFRKYIDEQYGPGNVREFDFRAKRKGLRPGINVRVLLNTGEDLMFSPGQKETFFKLYESRLIKPEFCENCRFTGYPKQADITIGDFWGIGKHDPDFMGGRTQFALLNNPKGEELFENIKSAAVKIKEKDFSLVTNHNRNIRGNKAHPMREMFKLSVLSGRGVKETAEIIFMQIDGTKEQKELNKAQIEELHLYYRHPLLNRIIRPFISYKMKRKLESSPSRFFADSKSAAIRLIGKFYK